MIARAFSSEVDTGSREENASKQKDRAPFRFNRNGKGSSSSIPKLLRPAQFIGGLFGGIQQLLDLAALGTHDGPSGECNRLHFLLIGVGSDLRGHFLMHGDVVQRTKAVLQA